ncbi:MAG: hypothetical protein ACW99U_14595 [Candidatus Thorarchaeota archaeon]
MKSQRAVVAIMEWKQGAKRAVCLTLDLDPNISWRSILGRIRIERDNPVVLSLRQYGPRAAVSHTLRLLDGGQS